MLDWVEKVIHWELCKKVNFERTTKWYMHKTKFVKENETHKLLWDFEMQTGQLTSASNDDIKKIRKSAE